MEDKLIDAEVLTQLIDDMKGNHVIPDVDTVLRQAPDFTELTKLDPADYETCLCPSFRTTSVMPEPVYDKECFREFMDELIAYIEDPTPTRAALVRTLQRRYNISIFITEYPERLEYRVSISLSLPGHSWRLESWDEMVSEEVVEIICKAVEFL